MSTVALVVARFFDPENLLPAAEVLEQCDSVSCWNAVDGDIDLVVNLKTPASRIPKEIQNLAGIEDLRAFDLVNDPGDVVCDPELCHSYLFIEVQPERCEAIKASLIKLGDVSFCSTVSSGGELVAIVNGRNFSAIDRIIDEQIQKLDGILRIKQDRVIHLKQL